MWGFTAGNEEEGDYFVPVQVQSGHPPQEIPLPNQAEAKSGEDLNKKQKAEQREISGEQGQSESDQTNLNSQPPKKRKLTVGLFTRNSECSMENYINNSFLKRDEKEEREIKAKVERMIQEIDEHPDEYFNFGFHRKDFQKFISLLFQRRVHRQFVEKKINENVKEMKNTKKSLEQDPSAFYCHFPKRNDRND